jgi:GNAT superfamily N-acetyltransferase
MKFIKSLNIDVESEYKTFGYKYDIFVPKNNLLIEFHGLKWHGSEESKKRDKIKYDLAIKHDYSYLVVYEDEWKYRKESIKNLVKNRLNKFKPISIRPKQCDLRKTSLQEADFLYEQFHYIGKAKSKLNYGAWYKNQLIACMSFKNPTRQSKHDYELVRMVSHPNFRVHGIWTKLLNMFVLEHNLKSIVSFSDNRLFSGKIYEKLGFKFDGLISSDYFWTKNKKRYHKSSLRKKGEEKLSGKTETQLREAQGYYKIWDLGKKRWVINVENKN